MKHQYSKKFKHNKNLPYAKVGRHLFASLFAAEEYCMTKGLNPDSDIEYEDSPEFKQMVIELAKNNIATLTAAIEALDTRYETLKAEHLKAVADWREAQERRDIIVGYYENRAKECCAKVGECYECWRILCQQREEMYKITGWHK